MNPKLGRKQLRHYLRPNKNKGILSHRQPNTYNIPRISPELLTDFSRHSPANTTPLFRPPSNRHPPTHSPAYRTTTQLKSNHYRRLFRQNTKPTTATTLPAPINLLHRSSSCPLLLQSKCDPSCLYCCA